MTFAINSFNNVSSGAAAGPRLWSYGSTTDTLATITAADYFLAVFGSLSVDDQIYVAASDGTGTFKVLAASSTTVTLGESVGSVSAAVTVTSAELLALRATPKTLVTAPGAGRMLLLESVALQLDYNTTQYTETADNMAVKYTNGAGVAVSTALEATGFIDQAADTTTRGLAVLDAIVANAAAANQALVLHNTGDGEYAAGDSPLVVNVFYRVVASV